jgi:hypothetical protein
MIKWKVAQHANGTAQPFFSGITLTNTQAGSGPDLGN